LNRFLSEENIALHLEYVRDKRLKYSIIESSFPMLSGKSVHDVFRMKLNPRDKLDAVDLLSEIKLHDIFFSSFSKTQYPRCREIEEKYGSEAEFLNSLYRLASSRAHGFALVYLHGTRIEIDATSDYPSAFRIGQPVLAIDICEHSYFMDYGFDKERYLISMLPYLDITKLSANSE
jgi:superoxide dismutase